MAAEHAASVEAADPVNSAPAYYTEQYWKMSQDR